MTLEQLYAGRDRLQQQCDNLPKGTALHSAPALLQSVKNFIAFRERHA